MSSPDALPSAANRPARKAHFFVFCLLLLGLAAAAAFGWTAYHLHLLRRSVGDHSTALLQYQNRQEAIFALDNMQTALYRFMLDGNTANLELILLNKERIERLVQKDALNAQPDPMLQDMVAREQQWYAQFAQPMIEERKLAPPGQGLPEDLLNRYRSAKQDLNTFDYELTAHTALLRDQVALTELSRKTGPGAVLRYVAACLAVVMIFMLGVASFRNIGRLHRVARGEDGEAEEEEEEEEEKPEGDGAPPDHP